MTLDPREDARLAAWRHGLILDLGQSLRAIVRMMHPDPMGLVILMDVAKRFKASVATIQGMKLYWRLLCDGGSIREDER